MTKKAQLLAHRSKHSMPAADKGILGAALASQGMDQHKESCSLTPWNSWLLQLFSLASACAGARQAACRLFTPRSASKLGFFGNLLDAQDVLAEPNGSKHGSQHPPGSPAANAPSCGSHACASFLSGQQDECMDGENIQRLPYVSVLLVHVQKNLPKEHGQQLRWKRPMLHNIHLRL